MVQKLPFLIAILIISIAPMADTYVLIPAMSDIGKALPGASLTQLNLILTIPSLLVVPSSLIAGKLVETGRLSKKSCLLLGFSIFTIGGAAGGLVVDIYYLLFTRAVLGIGNGLATAMIVTLTYDFFTEQEAASVMGLYNAFGSLIAIGLTIISGYLVVVNWRLAFLVYLVCLLIILYHSLVLKKTWPGKNEPEAEFPEVRTDQTSLAPDGRRPSLGRAVWVLIAITICSQTLGNTLYLGLSYFIEGEGLGDASSTGLANGLLTGASVLISLAFGRIYGRMGKQTQFLFFSLMALGFFLLSRSHSFFLALLALVVWGLGYGLSIPYAMQEAIVCPPKQLITFTGSLVNSCIFLSFVLSTFVQPLFAAISGDDGLRFYFQGVGIMMAACGVLSVILIKTMKSIKS